MQFLHGDSAGDSVTHSSSTERIIITQVFGPMIGKTGIYILVDLWLLATLTTMAWLFSKTIGNPRLYIPTKMSLPVKT